MRDDLAEVRADDQLIERISQIADDDDRMAALYESLRESA